MEQKEINKRIAMAMLKVCALIWEFLTDNPHKGEFKLSDLLSGMVGRNRSNSKPGSIEIAFHTCDYPDVFREKLLKIDGVAGFNDRESVVKIAVPTNGKACSSGFECVCTIYSVFWLVRKFCRINGCSSLLDKTVFGYDANGRWTRLPEVKPHKARKAAKAKTLKVKEPKHEPTLAEKLRAALAKMKVA